ncbi:Cytochrome P450 4c3 [Halotydeus destructor]|nr:Cytochrome P450 4c3 [Halotydeus destructor]
MVNFSPDAALVGLTPFFLLLATSFMSTDIRADAQSHWAALTTSANRVFNTRGIILSMLVTSVLVIVYRKWMDYRRKFLLLEKIPGPPCHPIPFLGHAGIVLELDRAGFKYGTYALIYQMLTGITGIFQGEKLVKMWMGARPFVLIFTPEAVETVLSSNTLTEKSVEYDWLKPWLGEGLVTSSKYKWRARRKVLTPAFHFRILEDFQPIINEQAHVLINKLARLAQKGQTEDIDFLPLATLCTLDTICETAMGIKVGCQENESDYVKSLHQLSGIVITRLTRPWLWPDWIFHLSRHGRRFNQCLKIMQDFTMSVIKDRKRQWIENSESKMADNGNEPEVENGKGAGNRRAFLDLLLEQHMVNKWSLEDMREELDNVHAGLHLDIQEKVREEVDAIFDQVALKSGSPEGQEKVMVNSEMMKNMKYLDCVLKEVQRIYPTAPFIGRLLSSDTVISGYQVPKGTTCGILTFLLHRNADIFPNPEKFDPERFRPENSVGRHPFAYVPFSAGPRNCIGQKFALMEQKIVIANMVRNFHVVSLDPRDKLIVVGEMVLRPRNGLHMKITRRTFNTVPDVVPAPKVSPRSM